jgi:hypothetical protein
MAIGSNKPNTIMDKKRRQWRILSIIAIVLCLLVFTPFVIPQGVYKPELFGVPYSLWTSFLITVALVVLTYFGTKVHRTDEEETES